jgi:murein DD-endopeptidase MepM/ murein hydrolase activator NlpD
MVHVGRIRRLVALAAAVCAAAGAMVAAPAAAQTSTTDPATTTSPTTSPDPTATISPTDGDAPPASVPDVSITVPPREPPEGAAPQPGRVVSVNVRGARASVLARQAAYTEAVIRRAEFEQNLARLQSRIGELAAAARKAVLDLAAAKRELTARAVDAYVRGSGFDTVSFDAGSDAGPDEQRNTMLAVIVDHDRAAIDRVRELQARVSADQAQTAVQLTEAQSQLEQATVDEDQAELALFDAKLDLAVSSVGGTLVIHGFVFPVADPHTFSSTFGAPRSGGRSHEGNDIFAPMGTPLLASERGVIDNMGTGTLGGIKLWLVGESGTQYYYAHLIGFAEGITDGTVVEAGDIVGYVGNTGNAISTPPHLHYEIHPGGGAAIDPYPLLHAVDQIDGERVLPGLDDRPRP